jgi:hypothetical protein
MNIKIKKILVSIGLGSLIGNSIVMYVTFLMAYFNDYQVMIAVNKYNEAHVEFFFIPIIFIIGLWTVNTLLSRKKVKDAEKI